MCVLSCVAVSLPPQAAAVWSASSSCCRVVYSVTHVPVALPVPPSCSVRPVGATQGVVDPGGAPTGSAVGAHASLVLAVVRSGMTLAAGGVLCILSCHGLACTCFSSDGLCRRCLLWLKWTKLSKKEGGRCVCVCVCVRVHGSCGWV